MAQQVESQTNDIASLKELVLDLKTTLTKKIDEVNDNITREVNRLEEKLTGEIDPLKNADAKLLDSFTEFRDESNGKIDNLRAELDETKSKLQTQTDNLIATTGQMLVQQKKIVSLEKDCHRGLQHGRGFNIEIDGIPKDVGDEPEELEEAALKIFSAIGVDINDYDIDTIHRLPSKKEPKATIARFVSRKTVREIHLNKSKLKNMKNLRLDIAGITNESQIFIRASQCSYYKNLGFNCRKLKRAGLISKVITGKDGRITIILNDGKKWLQVSHESDLITNFPEFLEFDFNYDEFVEQV